MALSKEDKKRLIKLQNVLFDSDEHMLMVSPAFLEECVKKYLIKHLRSVNTCMMNIKVTKNPALFYSSIPPLIDHLDELIKIEDLYEMSRPIPSVFKKDFEDNRNLYASNMIKRYIHEAKQHVPAPQSLKSPVVKKYYQETFDTLMSFKTEMSKEEINLADVFYNGIFKRNYSDPIPENEYDSPDNYDDDDLPEDADENGVMGHAPSDEDLLERTATGEAVPQLDKYGEVPGSKKDNLISPFTGLPPV
jgi:hypothetical protein